MKKIRFTILSFSFFLIIGCAHVSLQNSKNYVFIPPDRRRTTPEITGLTINASSNPSLASEKGKVLVLLFWAPWCRPSLSEVKTWVEIHDKYQNQGVDFICLADEIRRKWTKENLINYFQELRIDYPVAVCDFLTEVKYKITWFPTIYFIDRSGKLAGIYIDKDYQANPTMSETIETLLKEPNSSLINL